MTLLSVEIKSVRNLQSEFVANPRFNVFFGLNGSGKTSILEAISLLSSGKSFRQPTANNIIQYDSLALTIFGWIMTKEGHKKPAGIEKTREGKTSIRLDGQSASVAALAECLPLQVIHPESEVLITGSPKWRRQFLDWGLFHVEQTFFPVWQRLQKALKQRNAVLKITQDKMHISSWDPEYVQSSEIVSQYRKTYVQEFQPYFQEMIQYFLPEKDISIEYQRGWPEETALSTLLSKNFYKDLQLGYTYYGSQRDDIGIFCDSAMASDVLSRGEQKLVVIALRLAQGKYLKEKTAKRCLYLLDDFAAELDGIHRKQLVGTLSHLESQIFLTTIDFEEVRPSLEGADLYAFHVEHGRIYANIR